MATSAAITKQESEFKELSQVIHLITKKVKEVVEEKEMLEEEKEEKIEIIKKLKDEMRTVKKNFEKEKVEI